MKWLLVCLLVIGCEVSDSDIRNKPDYPKEFDTRLFGTWISIDTTDKDTFTFEYVNGRRNSSHFIWYSVDNSIKYSVDHSGNWTDDYLIEYMHTNYRLLQIDIKSNKEINAKNMMLKRVIEFNDKLLGEWKLDGIISFGSTEENPLDSSTLIREFKFLDYVNDFGKETSIPINLITNKSCDTLEYSYGLDGDIIRITEFNYDKDYDSENLDTFNLSYDYNVFNMVLGNHKAFYVKYK